MSVFSIGFDIGHVQVADAPDPRVFTDIPQDAVVPLPAGQGPLPIRILSPEAYKGFYTVQTDDLPGGPVNLTVPRIDQASQSVALGVSVQGLWAHDAAAGAPVRTYRWQRDGADIAGATGLQYTPVQADEGRSLQVVETVADAGGQRSRTSNPLTIAALPDPFEVTLEPGALLRLVANDGRAFPVQDPDGIHGGTYSVDPARLVAGPTVLEAPKLAAITVAEAGATLAITPPLFAYDAALGTTTISYTASGTNSVDASDPAAPTVRVGVADADGPLSVTATARQNGVTLDAISNTLEIAALPEDLFEVMIDEDTDTLQIIGNDGRDFTVDDPTGRYGGSYRVNPGDLAAGPVALIAPVLNGDPAVGATLALIPPLFAYDPALGTVEVTYAADGTHPVNLTDPDNPTLLIDAADAGATVIVTARATQGINTTDSPSAGVSVPVASLSHTILPLQTSSAATNTPSFTLDLSAFEAGDRLILAYGPFGGEGVSEATVGGAAAPLVQQGDAANRGGANITAWDYALTGSEGASEAVVVTNTNPSALHILAAVVVSGGTRDDSDGAEMPKTPQTISLNVTPAAADNVLIAFAIGDQGIFADHAWTGVTEQLLADPAITAGSVRSCAVAIAQDVPVSARTVTLEPSTSAPSNAEAGVIVLAYS